MSFSADSVQPQSECSLKRVFITPLLALRKAAPAIVLFSSLVVGASLALIKVVTVGLAAVLTNRLHLPVDRVILAQNLIAGLLWLALAPALLLAVITPLRALWYERRITLMGILAETNRNMEQAYLVTFAAISGIVLALVGIAGAYVGVRLYLLHSGYVELSHYAASVVAFSLLLASLRGLLNFVVIPFLALGSNMSLREVLASAEYFLEGRRVRLATIIMAGLLLIQQIAILAPSLAQHYPYPLFVTTALVTAAIWYTLACATTLCLSATEGKASAQMRVIRRAATPMVLTREAAQPAISIAAPVEPTFKRRRETVALTPMDRELMFS